ncbi:hypothetical protein A2576_03520 [Candidatus Amesbacteria bacterium RIFOXYD1_FULL_47_9]|uniref:Glycosyltransferase 2-like domain-containing protein n=1 Tax=Candidatus Amesbacteria bacterium RIFOXYD1_FULL_47_9 TaxID=1797267 RepID=A0A1F5A1Z6_9BACT|nr:MAG: hypothetical protein A2W16_03235 [Candidatus Amesbacteria bacterium RBG_16_48_31]OGD04640.1 MAG: hypothetical protein A3B58_02855 [Candidatus Amesbacteria bacterium RIFCSPLOWO2_01_FULL_48_50]OGD11877.1 MAG: hypothetical protein A2576_03520 [Candidatus Amesbacteria bacterium RIFOXYD1_FULL_47_9]
MIPRLPKVIVAIPAYNEAANLPSLLSALLSQARPNFILLGIWVVSDGSTDDTVAKAQSFGHPVKTFAGRTRRGKFYRFNQIAARFNADILIQIDADVLITSDLTLSRLVSRFQKPAPPDLVSAYHLALPPVTGVEKAAYFGFRVWDHARVSLGEKALRYYCEGGLRAFSARFIHQFRLPPFPTSEDSYSFYYAVTRGFKVAFAPGVRVYIKLPSTLADYVRQMTRFLSAPDLLARSFPESVLRRYEVITPWVKIISFFAVFMASPLIGLSYIYLQLIARINKLFYRPRAAWDISPSTKTVSL